MQPGVPLDVSSAPVLGRDEELRQLEQFLTGATPAQVAIVHGPLGTGKSALLRGAAAIAAEEGFTIVEHDARKLVAESEEQLLQNFAAEKPLVIVERCEKAAPSLAALWRGALGRLPPRARILMESRIAPEPEAWDREWDHRVVEFELGPLATEDARAMLEGLGVTSDAVARQLIEWSAGSPLALMLGAQLGSALETAGTDPEAVRQQLMRRLWRHIAPLCPSEPAFEALSVASIARTVTADLLANTGDEFDGAWALRWLSHSGLTMTSGHSLRVAPAVRQAALTELQRQEPGRELELRRRVIDHLCARGAQQATLTMELAAITRSKAIGNGYGWPAASDFTIRTASSDDGTAVAAQLHQADLDDWWEGLRPFFEAAPERVTVAVDRRGRIGGYCIAVTPANAPAMAYDDPILSSRLRHARDVLGEENVVIWRDSWDFTADDLNAPGGLQGMLHVGSVMHAGAANPRYCYVSVSGSKDVWSGFLDAVSARRLPELDVGFAAREIECHLVDLGPRGLIGAQREMLLYELGAAPPPFEAHPAEKREEKDEEPRDLRAEIAFAVRNYQRPDVLSSSPLAPAGSPDERVAAMRKLVDEALEGAFGVSESEARLKTTLVRAYVDPTAGHDQAALDLHVSRTTYFRWLKSSLFRVVDYIEQRRS